MKRLVAMLRLLACLFCLAAQGASSVAAGGAPVASSAWSTAPHLAEEKKDETCGQGKATKAFGWKVVDFGVSTAKYLIGLLLIPIGLFLVFVGAVVEIVESVTC